MNIPIYAVLLGLVTVSVVGTGNLPSRAIGGDKLSNALIDGSRYSRTGSATGPKHSTISETISSLRTITTESDDVKVPEGAKPLLMRLKRQLRILVDNTVNQDPEATPEYLQQMVLSELAINGIKIEERQEVIDYKDYVDHGYTYGDIDAISIQR